MLARQTWVLGWNARAIGAVATGAGRDLTIGNATAVNALTQTHQLGVGGRASGGFLAGQPIRHVAHVFVGHGSSKTAHDGVGALAGLVFPQLLDQVFWVLLCQLGIGGRGGIAICGVASHANLTIQSCALGGVGLDGLGLGAERQGGQGGGAKQRGVQFHVVWRRRASDGF
jgi:hypothetical protein